MSGRLILGVAGGSGSGKTTVVEEICRSLRPSPVSVIHHDSYYSDLIHLPFEERAELNFDHPEALETSLLVEHLTRLRAGGPVDVPVYDFSTHTRTAEVRRVEATGVIIVDGILVLADPRLRDLMDIKGQVARAVTRPSPLRSEQGDFHHSALPLRSLTEPSPRSERRSGVVEAGVP